MKIISEIVCKVTPSRMILHCERRARHLELVNQDMQTDPMPEGWGDSSKLPDSEVRTAPSTPPEDGVKGKSKKKMGLLGLMGGKGKAEKYVRKNASERSEPPSPY